MDDRRQQILDAALAVFLEQGFDGATLAAIRDRSGASIGSIYHFFAGKADIAAALLHTATSEWALHSQDAADSDDPESAVRASVGGLLRWGQQNPHLFDFMDDLLARSSYAAEFGTITQMLAAGRAAAEVRYRQWAERGLVRQLSWQVAYALMMGPAYAILRNQQQAIGDSEITAIVDAAWAAIAPPQDTE